jgi:hypothetical protein
MASFQPCIGPVNPSGAKALLGEPILFLDVKQKPYLWKAKRRIFWRMQQRQNLGYIQIMFGFNEAKYTEKLIN